MVRFSNSGTEAVMAALRLARAHTGKDAYVVVEGGYHGVFDSALWYTPVEDWKPNCGDPHLVPYSGGVPGILRALLHAVPMNDADRLESVFKAYGHELAAFLIEPIMGNCCSISATREYLHAARELCDRYGILMIIDEVKTGFRVARGGVQELFGVRADLCTFAKAMGNGYPISVLAGREDIMRRLGKGSANDRRLRHAPARGNESDSFAARHQAFFQRPPFDERPVLQRAAAAKLS
jgi:glutamate-1-semialdehyde 2,1-aminomutase